MLNIWLFDETEMKDRREQFAKIELNDQICYIVDAV